jgi:arylsulfatase
VIVLSLDTLRADRLGAWGNPNGLTPNLDRIAAEGVVFEQAYSQASETLFSHGSLFTSRYPSELGRLSYASALPQDVPTLPEVMQLYGYRTAASVGGIHLNAEYGFSRGFEAYFNPTNEAGSLYHTLPPALEWLDGLDDDDPFFLFLHSYDTHARYLKPPPFGLALTEPGYDRLGEKIAQMKGGTGRILDGYMMSGFTLEALVDLEEIRIHRDGVWRKPRNWANMRKQRLTEGDIDHLSRVYDGAVSYADAWVGRMMAGLADRGLLETTLIVVLSDHGEHLGEQGVFAHRYFLDDTTLHVPLMVRMPGGVGASRVAAPVALLDVAPTILDLVGATPPADIHGRSLLPALHGEPIPGRDVLFAEGMFRMISARGASGRLTFTGVGADSAFLPELLATSPLDGPAFEGGVDGVERASLHAAMQSWRGELHTATSTTAQISPALLQELRENGYWGEL